MASSSVKSTVPLPDTIVDPETNKTYKKGKFLGKVCCVFMYHIFLLVVLYIHVHVHVHVRIHSLIRS